MQPAPEDPLTGWLVAAVVPAEVPAGELAGDREQAATTAKSKRLLTMNLIRRGFIS
jgi:hypothetical protein